MMDRPGSSNNVDCNSISLKAKTGELLKQGKKEEARKEVEAFKAAWPDYELPADLK